MIWTQRPGEERQAQWRRWFAEHGWIVGDNLDIQFVDFGQEGPQREQRAREIVAREPDVVAGPGGSATRLFQPLTTTVPIVFYNYGADPVRAGWVRSVREPGGNITGTIQRLTELIPKSWQLLKEIRPQATKAAELATREFMEGPWAAQIRELHAYAARSLGFTYAELLFPASSRFGDVKELLKASGAQLLSVSDDVYRLPWMRDLLEHVQAARIPAVYYSSRVMRNGGLLSITPDFQEGERHAVAIIARILGGERPATIPVYETTRYHTALNRRTAEAMGLAIPPAVLVKVDEVVR